MIISRVVPNYQKECIEVYGPMFGYYIPGAEEFENPEVVVKRFTLDQIDEYNKFEEEYGSIMNDEDLTAIAYFFKDMGKL